MTPSTMPNSPINAVATSLARHAVNLARGALVSLLVTACGFPRPADVGDDAGISDGSPGTGDGSSGTGVIDLALLAGDIGGAGNVDGIGANARFANPTCVAVDRSGNLYIADFNNAAIRKITSTGVVTTLAGPAAGFELPQAVAVDGSGNVYVADENSSRISKITAAGVVAEISGVGASAPQGIAVDGSGNVYVADTGNNSIRKVTPGGVVTTLAGPGAQLNIPSGLAVDTAGNVYVADSGNSVIRKVTPDGTVTTLAGTVGSRGSTDGTGPAARFSSPDGVGVDGSGNVYVADSNNSTIRKVTPAGVVTTLAGAAGITGSSDGTGSAARFNGPLGVASDSAGNIFVADTGTHLIRKITPAAVVTTLAGRAPAPGTADGYGASARFNAPAGIAVDGTGNFYVADANNDTIRKVTPAGLVTTVAGTPGSIGSADGTGAAARFFGANGIAVDSAGIVDVADTFNFTIRQIAAGDVVTTLAGSAGTSGSSDGTGMTALFNEPHQMTLDSAGNIYVADTFSFTIRKVTAAGLVTTVAGKAGTSGSLDGTGTLAQFNAPQGIAIDSTGNLYVADTGNFTIRKITPAGIVSTLAGSARSAGTADGIGATARFLAPRALVVDHAGNLYVADTGNSTIRKITQGGVVTTVAGTPRISGIVLGNKPGLASPTSLVVAGNSLVITDTNAVLMLEHIVE